MDNHVSPKASPTKEEWANWLRDSEHRLCESYSIRPESLIADYRKEHEIQKGYHGREILELLQNAGDAAREAGVDGRVKIELHDFGLLFANTGSPFQHEGIRSLITANLSPKRKKESSLIGDKGLGFRSILNWTDSPQISSGHLDLAYSEGYSIEILNRLMANQEVTRFIEEERTHSSGLILPRLAFPKHISNWETEYAAENTAHQQIAQRLSSLRKEGFDTVVGMSFTRDEAFEEAKEQLSILRPEILIFVDSLASLSIQIKSESDRKTWRRDVQGKRLSVFSYDQLRGSWYTHEESGEIPSELTDPEESNQSRYEIKIAVPEGEVTPQKNPLFCYFQTDVELPLSPICHATLRLDETRKHLTNNKANRFILKRLAEGLGDLAEELASKSKRVDWAAFRILFRSSDFSSELVNLGFDSELKRVAASREIVPSLAGVYRKAPELRVAYCDDTHWLPARLFPDVVKLTSPSEAELCSFMEIEKLATTAIVQAFEKTEGLTLEERAKAIVGILGLTNSTEKRSSSLLLDQDGQKVPPLTQVMLEPSGSLPAIPDWAKIRFLNPELRRKLRKLLKTNDTRELQQALKPFGVVEYSLASLIRPIVIEANRYLKNEDKDLESLLWQETLHFLFQIYNAFSVDEKRPQFPSDVHPLLPNLNGGHTTPDKLYLSESYGLAGRINQDLFSKWAPEKLVAPLGALGLSTKNTRELTSFLEWMGVAQWPREIELKSPEYEYVDFVAGSVKYPAQFENRHYNSRSELDNPRVYNAKTVEGLNENLERAPWSSVLAWMAHDERFARWRKPSSDAGTLAVWPPYCHYARSWSGRIAFYIHWKISRTRWLLNTVGELVAPAECLLGERSIESLFPRPIEPDPESIDRFELDGLLSFAFQNAGVAAGLSHLTREELYRLLLEMPDRSPDGKAARGLYRWLLQHDHTIYGQEGDLRDSFLKSGKMWGTQKGESTYFKISELYHVDTDGFPQGLLDDLCLVDLPRRVGSDKVNRIFGIKSVERSGIRQTILKNRINPMSVIYQEQFLRAKPYIKKLRQTQSTHAEYVRSFDRLELLLCDELQVEMSYEDSSSTYDAGDWEWIQVDDVVYVKSEASVDQDLLADSLGSAIASVFRVGEGDAYAKLFRCKPSSRKSLLRRMCGDSIDDEIEESSKQHSKGAKYTGPIATPTRREEEAASEMKGADEGKETASAEVETEQGVKTETVPLVTPTAHNPASEPRRNRVAVKKVTSKPRAGTTRQVTDGDLCERKAVEFEENSQPPRFPLRVGHITGYEAPGVDILSFASAEERDLFQDPETRDASRVLRYIEVKGRSSSTAKIELKGNELAAAQRETQKYYIYRLFLSGRDEYEFSILQDPLDSKEALSTAIWVDLDRAESTERFVLNEIPIREDNKDQAESLNPYP